MNKRKKSFGKAGVYIFFIIFSLCFIIPFLYVISASFSADSAIKEGGYSLIPKTLDISSYKYVFANPHKILQAYKVTIIFSFTGTFLALLTMALCAYSLSRPCFAFKNIITFYIFFTMLFGGGLIPSYILNTRYLNLGNTIWIYILPSLANAFHIIIIRTFFQQLPSELFDSAKIDGAREMKIFFSIMLPLSTPVLATIGFMTLLALWNNWQTSLIYITNEELYSLQYLLQRILRETEFVKSMIQNMPSGVDLSASKSLPNESIKFAMAIVATGPMLFAFPFFQKYFSSGLTIGAVKG